MLGNDFLGQRLDGFFIADIQYMTGYCHVVVLEHARRTRQGFLVDVAQHHIAAPLASSTARYRPMPEPAPVMTATFCIKSRMSALFF